MDLYQLGQKLQSYHHHYDKESAFPDHLLSFHMAKADSPHAYAVLIGRQHAGFAFLDVLDEFCARFHSASCSMGSMSDFSGSAAAFLLLRAALTTPSSEMVTRCRFLH